MSAPSAPAGPQADWRPTPTELRAVHAAMRSLEVWTGWLWEADLRQAALIALWQTQDKRRQYSGSDFAIAFGFARRAMRQEWRRITERHPGTKAKPGDPVQFADSDDVVLADEETPEMHLQRAQAVRQAIALPGPLANALAARLEHDSMRDAAEALGVDHACLQTRLYRAMRALQDQHAGKPVRWAEGKGWRCSVQT